MDKSAEFVIIPVGEKKIAKGAFKESESLKRVQIPTSVTRIEKDAFANWRLLRRWRFR